MATIGVKPTNMKIYEIVFSFLDPTKAMGTFTAETEEDAVEKLKENIGPHVQELEIVSVEYKGELDELENEVTPASSNKQLLN